MSFVLRTPVRAGSMLVRADPRREQTGHLVGDSACDLAGREALVDEAPRTTVLTVLTVFEKTDDFV